MVLVASAFKYKYWHLRCLKLNTGTRKARRFFRADLACRQAGQRRKRGTRRIIRTSAHRLIVFHRVFRVPVLKKMRRRRHYTSFKLTVPALTSKRCLTPHFNA